MMLLQEVCLKRKYGAVRWSKAAPLTSVSKERFCGRSLAGIAGSNSAGGMDVSCECYVFSGRGLCVGLITRPEEP